MQGTVNRGVTQLMQPAMENRRARPSSDKCFAGTAKFSSCQSTPAWLFTCLQKLEAKFQRKNETYLFSAHYPQGYRLIIKLIIKAWATIKATNKRQAGVN